MAIRSGIALTSTYAFSQCSRLMKTVDDRAVRSDIKKLQKRLDSKIKLSRSGRGNAFLESALPLAKSLRRSIVALGRRVEQAAQAGEATNEAPRRSLDSEQQLEELRAIIDDMKDLLAQLDNDIPLLHMAISASGESLSSAMSPSVSPSRFLQAGTFLTYGDSQFAADPTRPVQIGPVFTLSIYMLFLGHASRTPTTQPGHREGHSQPPQKPQNNSSGDTPAPYGLGEGERKPLWQEVIHKARVRLCRTPMGHVFDPNKGFRPSGAGPSSFTKSQFYKSNAYGMGQRNEYAYHLEIIEDMDDGRAHDDLDAEAAPYDDIRRAGIRESIPIHQISKIFYADTGRILNIGDGGTDNNPVLLLKRDLLAKPPLEMQEEMMAYSDEADSIIASEAEDEEGLDEQEDIDRQLREESAALDILEEMPKMPAKSSRRSFPSHLDPEWLAVEVFEDDDESESSETEDEDLGEEVPRLPLSSTPISAIASPKTDSRRSRASLDTRLMAQIQSLSLQSSPSATGTRSTASVQPFSQELAKHQMDSTESFVARSPFGAVVTSLSLMEMLIRLTSLQEFQQAPHLTMHDHILNFFLEESSTTGLTGEERLRARTEAKQRVGFDPYTDTPSR
ncbi:RanBP-type and C3HC4-type zinc finger-containing protein 1 [Colletotrichum spaethianum]|uniref:RanBP-type and C3HC4-type zinc finger-containing protein 1 n=1 Tax=Colletotrichum spaethianum TaxID=700344 RepID=A0AA37LCH8_9PEZI|nr:RanBP-type and C3HC4-type zinc finger-containing protein 1 [Colletotrichum spaethianum]GKT44070.1 RanBP-type and C3HC4-type zinc finger-containing protein 1 [Colletotrichum spaethianum]